MPDIIAPDIEAGIIDLIIEMIITCCGRRGGEIGHDRLISKIKDEVRSVAGLFLAGNYMDGVSVAACLESGERTAREVAALVS